MPLRVILCSANSSNTAGAASGSTQDATKFQVKIRIDEKENFLPGMSVTAEIQTRSRTNVLCVPVQSVTTRMPKPKELALAGKGANTKGQRAGAVAADPPTNAACASTNAAATSTNAVKAAEKTARKSGEAPKPIEVVFVVDGDHVKQVPVERGINDETYAEITEGLSEGQEVISGGYKAISRELEDGKKIRKEKPGTMKGDKEGENK